MKRNKFEYSLDLDHIILFCSFVRGYLYSGLSWRRRQLYGYTDLCVPYLQRRPTGTQFCGRSFMPEAHH